MHGSASPFDHPVPRGLNVVLATLRIAVAVVCWGWAVGRLNAHEDFGLIGVLAHFGGLSEATLQVALDRVAWGLLLCGLLTLFRPCWPVLAPVTLWFLLVAAIGPRVGEPLRPLSDAVRYLTPLALLLLDFWPPRAKFSLGRARVALVGLRIGAVLTFAGQGILALEQSRQGGELVELTTQVAHNVLRLDLAASDAARALGIAGGIELGLALGLLLVRSRIVAGVMAGWGALLAMCFVFAFGSRGNHEVLLHAADAGAPFALCLYWMLAVREQPAVTLPANR